MRHVNDPQRQLLQMLQLRRHIRLQLRAAYKERVFPEVKTKKNNRSVSKGRVSDPPFFFVSHDRFLVGALLVNRPAGRFILRFGGAESKGCAPACHNVSPANACIGRSPPAETHATGTPADFRNDRTAAYPISITATSSTNHRKISCVSVHCRGSTQSAFTTSGPNCPTSAAASCVAFTRRAKSYSAPSARSCP